MLGCAATLGSLVFHTIPKLVTYSDSRKLRRSIDIAAFVLICTSVIAGAFIRRDLPSVPIPDSDSWGYVSPALSWLGGAGFQQSEGRDWLYPAILAVILKLGGDFSAIVRVQQCLGLLAAPIMWSSFRIWLSLFCEQRVFLYLMTAPLGLTAVYLYVLNPSLALFDISVRPEGVLPFFTLLYLLFVTAYFQARWRSRSIWLAIGCGAGCLALSYAILLLRPSWGLSFGFTFAFLIAGIFRNGTRTIRFLPLLTGIGLVAALAICPRLIGFQRDSASRLFLPTTLVSIHAPQIVESGRKHGLIDQEHNNSLTQETVLCQALETVLIEARKRPGYTSLGFDPDYIKYDADFFGRLEQKEHWTDGQLAAACYSAYFKAWAGAPKAMLEKIMKQLAFFLSVRDGDIYTHSLDQQQIKDHLSKGEILRMVAEEPYLANLPSYASYVDRVNQARVTGWQIQGASVLRLLATVVARLALWIQLAFFASATIVFLKSRFSQLRLPALAAAVTVTAVYGNVLTVALVHSLGAWRYRAGYIPPFLLSLAMMTTFCLFFVVRWWRGKPG
jgi:hypothetical protein